jgi:hypothetical protein
MLYYSHSKGTETLQTAKKGETTMKFTIEKFTNIYFLTCEDGTIYDAWDEREFTARKINSTMKKISKKLGGNVVFEKKF